MNHKTGWRRLSAPAVVAVVAVLATACGGSGAPSATASYSYAQELALAQCMRGHGLPSFPDPSPAGGFSLNAQTVASTRLHTAYAACRHLLPGDGPSLASVEQQAQQAQQKALLGELKLSKCMHSHGVPDFPDPTSSGLNLKGSGVNPSSPQFQAATKACQDAVPGLHLQTHQSTGAHTK
jgi:hypothetical protein